MKFSRLGFLLLAIAACAHGIAQRTTTLNNDGLDIAAEDHSRTDGWEIPALWGSPVASTTGIYVTTMFGITYVIDSKAPVLDDHALLAVKDLGPNGETWSGCTSWSRMIQSRNHCHPLRVFRGILIPNRL